MIDVYYHPRCSTCKKAIKWLNENQIEYQLYDLLKNPPTKENLKNWITVSNLPLKNFFNTSGQHYRQQNLKDKVDQMTLDETCELLSQDGMLIKRPLAVNQDHVTIGFNEKMYNDTWK